VAHLFAIQPDEGVQLRAIAHDLNNRAVVLVRRLHAHA